MGIDDVIGDNKVESNASIYDAVNLEDDVFCGPSMVFTNVCNPRAAIERKHECRRKLVRRGSTIGANATIVRGVTTGGTAVCVATGAVMTRDVSSFALMAKVPARKMARMSEFGERVAESPR